MDRTTAKPYDVRKDLRTFYPNHAVEIRAQIGPLWRLRRRGYYYEGRIDHMGALNAVVLALGDLPIYDPGRLFITDEDVFGRGASD